MKIVLTGSLGNISKPLAIKLIEAGNNVTIVSSSQNKAAEIEAIGGRPAIGSVNDISFLTNTFKAADVVYTMIPNDLTSADFRKHIASVGHNYAEAIKASGVNKVVLLSSIGAHINGGTGPISGLYDVEQEFNKLNGVDIKILRPAFFYTNFLGSIDMIKHMGIMGSNYAENNTLLMVHPNDIAGVVAYQIQQPFSGTTISYIVSDERTPGQVASVLGNAIGKPDLKWVEFTNEENLQGMLQAGLPQGFAKSYTEMGEAVKKEILWDDYLQHKPAEFGKTKLEDFALEFAGAFNK